MTQNTPRARETIREGLEKIRAGEAMVQEALDKHMWKGKGEEPRKSNSDPRPCQPERSYTNDANISPMFEYVFEKMPDTDPEKAITRSMYGDFRAYKRLTGKQFHRLQRSYFAYDGPDL